MKSETVIGFGGTFYTLWTFQKEIKYYTALDGRHYPSYPVYHYSYIKNISTDLDKVKNLHPNISIDMGLKGSSSFSQSKKEEDLSPEILKFGKYAGRSVYDIVKVDISYTAYMIDNYGYNKSWQLAKETSEYTEYITRVQREIDEKITLLRPVESGRHTLTINRNPDNKGVVIVEVAENHCLELRFLNIRELFYNGLSYYLPVFKDKAKRVKGKEFEYNLEVIETEVNRQSGYLYQIANVIN